MFGVEWFVVLDWIESTARQSNLVLSAAMDQQMNDQIDFRFFCLLVGKAKRLHRAAQQSTWDVAPARRR